MTCCNATSKDECNKQNKSHDESRNPWKASGAPVLGCHNSPPLTRDLNPRSRMASEGQTEEKRQEVSLGCFFDKRVRPKNLERLNKLKEEYNGDERDCEHSVR